MTVYIDILIFVNIVVNTVILWVSAAFLRQDPKPLRFIGAVLICCVYGFFVCLPEMSFLLNFFCKVFFGGVISLIAFKAKNFSSYIKNTFVVDGDTPFVVRFAVFKRLHICEKRKCVL